MSTDDRGPASALTSRQLGRDEIARIWEIDRREVIENIYYLEHGELVLKPEHYDVQGWPPGDRELYTPLLLDCFDRGGWFHGLFAGERLVAAACLDSKLIGPRRDLLQLKELHVSREYRGRGLGRQLFQLASAEARRRGAKRLYISATPSEHTIHFYLQLGCRPIAQPDPELFALEPEDIHLECPL